MCMGGSGEVVFTREEGLVLFHLGSGLWLCCWSSQHSTQPDKAVTNGSRSSSHHILTHTGMYAYKHTDIGRKVEVWMCMYRYRYARIISFKKYLRGDSFSTNTISLFISIGL